MNARNNIQCFHIVLAIWIITVVPLGFSESFQNRPTAGEMDDIVALGTECIRGVNERCWATQYQTNPVAYYVTAPFTNTTGWYLDQNAMGTMASKIRSLVSNYVDPNTVYNGTTNIVMLTVTGLWTSLGIGDHITNFTAIPATGTNPPTYGDCPGRIYVTNLQERYKVLSCLTQVKYIPQHFTEPYYRGQPKDRTDRYNYTSSWEIAIADAEVRFNAAGKEIPYWVGYVGAEGYTWKSDLGSGVNRYAAGIVRAFGHYYFGFAGEATSISRTMELYVKASESWYPSKLIFYDNGDDLNTNTWRIAENLNTGENYYEFVVGNTNVPMPAWGGAPPAGDWKPKGYVTAYPNYQKLIGKWNFNYCTNKYW